MLLSHVQVSAGSPVLFLHGLLGDKQNLNALIRCLPDYGAIAVDLRNHGQSFWHDAMDYGSLANDLLALQQHLGLARCAVIGHSLGGRVAMAFAQRYPERVSALGVIDIAPVTYGDRHGALLAALAAVPALGLASRADIAAYLQGQGVAADIIPFVLKNWDLKRTQWRCNVAVLQRCYLELMAWDTSAPPFLGKTLFIKGGQSDYLQSTYTAATLAQFPNARVAVIPQGGHWVHNESPQLVAKWCRECLL